MKKTKTDAPSLANPGEDAERPAKRNPLEEDRDRELDKILSTLRQENSGGGVVSLHRRAVNETSYGYLGEMAVDQYSVENVSKVYGGGDYKAQVKDSTKTIVKNFQFKIDYSIPAKFPGVGKEEKKMESSAPDLPAIIAALKSVLTPPPAPPPPPPPDNSMLIEMMRQQAETNRVLMAALVAPKSAAAPDPVTLQLLAEIKELRASGGGGRRGESFKDRLEEFLSLQQLIGGGGGAGGEAGEPAAPDRVGKLIEVFGPLVAQHFMNGGGAVQPNPVPAGLLPAPAAATSPAAPATETTAAPPNSAHPSPTPSAPPMNLILKGYVKQFAPTAIAAAQRGRDPYAWVLAKLDDIPATFHPAIFQLANGETWFADIFGGDPEATKHIDWLQGMRNNVLTFWLLAEIVAAHKATPKPEPEAFAKAFLDKASVSFEDTLWELVSDDAVWQKFQGEESHADEPWSETVRATFEKELDGEEDATPAPANVAAAPAAKVPPGTKVKPAKPVKG